MNKNNNYRQFFINAALTLSFLGALPSAFAEQKKLVLGDLDILKSAKIPILYFNENIKVGVAEINPEQEAIISYEAHEKGRCANFETLDENNFKSRATQQKIKNDIAQLEKLTVQNQSNFIYRKKVRTFDQTKKDFLLQALAQLKADELRSHVEFLSAFKSRYNKLPDPNGHIEPFIARLKAVTANAAFPVKIETVQHIKTKQKSIKLTITGQKNPDEIIVLGGHLDSISGWGGFGSVAPGADDNASGSAALVEALRVFTLQNQAPERTIEFYWYAGEESGLLGSAEIAQSAKAANKKIIAVLQLDMTSFPGDGVFKIASMTDFTTLWLRDYLVEINPDYINATILEDKCGYGCSDHASWFKQGYATLFPTESKYNSSFQYIHTDKDVISSVFNYDHALLFSKIALMFSLDLANSDLK